MGNIVNGLAIIFGGIIGTLFGKLIPKRVEETVIYGIGLAVIVIGIKSIMVITNILHIIIAITLGAIIGEIINLDDKFNQGAKWCEKQINKLVKGNIASGLIYGSLIYCVGPMAILGAIEMALFNDSSTLIAKAALDGITAVAFSSVLGIGVAFSGIVVFIYQGIIYLLAQIFGDFATGEMINSIKGLGGMLIFAIGLNITNITKIKVANLLPAFLFIILFTTLF
ncbi:hypothetical protein SAMN02745227_00626 [Anaerobranca californiensis DSM 14826]|jgi:uncharacterized membrane protein YqgA involved in biofilm formation|uniref:DUF554 domain-containing protein n=1 Tax=Anaerobranca californiensis DSM 14826 TaxID=1120989 RepID=A0A1M6M2K6_9FIRM|nr:DUF554 domain-containing protein [Anaerobranca californiensis]SHJ77712.1 hypothetical protein SAMN02745227_00626 [Anaerobranca californiensis DSM 14826]